jgi:hypothetical protein
MWILFIYVSNTQWVVTPENYKKGPSETLIETALSHRCSRSAVIVKQFMVAVNCMISKPTRNPIQENW